MAWAVHSYEVECLGCTAAEGLESNWNEHGGSADVGHALVWDDCGDGLCGKIARRLRSTASLGVAKDGPCWRCVSRPAWYKRYGSAHRTCTQTRPRSSILAAMTADMLQAIAYLRGPPGSGFMTLL